MKLLAITALFIAGALAVPASSSYPPPPPPEYGDDHEGDVGYGGDHGGDGDGYGYLPPPPPGYDDGGSYEPPTDGDGYPSDGGDDGGDSDGGGDGGYGERDHSNLCTSLLYSVPQCCATGVLGVANLDCASPSKAPHSFGEFKKICAGTGKAPSCCTLTLLGLGVLCLETPSS
ncbi:fungal hydrophobin domain-containing protein [Trichoderma velutinum]